MNEIIKECWLKAAREDSDEKWDTQVEFIERFAKLIVRETLNEMGEQMDKFGDDQSNNPTWYKSMEAVEKRFGMKERMNKRIRELAIQSGANVRKFKYQSTISVAFDDESFEKFAELIVKECANQCLSDDSMRILNHMGVKGVEE